MSMLERFGPPEKYQGGVVSIGNFDGVHRGHQRMIELLVAEARRRGVPAVVLTFQPHPLLLLRPEQAPRQLCTLARKIELLTQYGVDAVLPYPTDWDLLRLTPEEFFETIVRRDLQAVGLVEGPNFCFGRHRAGDVTTLRSLCDRSGLTLQVIESVEIEGMLVSSTRIRELLASADFQTAIGLLGHPYRVSGRVTRGDGRGRLIGFPTANLDEIETLLPADGVYAGTAAIESGRRHAAAVHVGSNPTFGQDIRKVEVHLLDFSGDVYDQTLNVDLISRIRGTTTFPGIEDLKSQLQRDIAHVRDIVGQMT